MLETLFTSLQGKDWKVTSPPTSRYNCIAYAAGRDDAWWWPIPGAYWPPSVRRELTVAAFQEAFASVGYQSCRNGSFRTGWEKVVLYADRQTGSPSHMARQLPSGKWTSKCGQLEDIEHSSLSDLSEGPSGYGEARWFFKRRAKGFYSKGWLGRFRRFLDGVSGR
jgi:hypothetical protein